MSIAGAIPEATASADAAGQEILDLALALGVMAIENGASTPVANLTFQKVVTGGGVDDGFAVWRLDSATAARTCHGGAAIVRPVGSIGENFRRVSEVTALAERAKTVALDRGTLRAEIERIGRLDSPYGLWTMLAATACTGGFFARISDGQWSGFAVAFVAAGVGQLVRGRLLALETPGPVATLICATVSALVAAVGLRMQFDAVAPGTLIASIIYLVPGVPLINGFIDIGAQQYLIIGVQRLASAVFLCTLLAVGVALAVTVMG